MRLSALVEYIWPKEILGPISSRFNILDKSLRSRVPMHLCDPVEEIPSHPEIVAHLDSLARTDLVTIRLYWQFLTFLGKVWDLCLYVDILAEMLEN